MSSDPGEAGLSAIQVKLLVPYEQLVVCESRDLICRTVSDCAALNPVECCASSGMKALGLAQAGGQAPEPRSGCAIGAGLPGMAERQITVIGPEGIHSDTVRQIKFRILHLIPIG